MPKICFHVWNLPHIDIKGQNKLKSLRCKNVWTVNTLSDKLSQVSFICEAQIIKPSEAVWIVIFV